MTQMELYTFILSIHFHIKWKRCWWWWWVHRTTNISEHNNARLWFVICEHMEYGKSYTNNKKKIRIKVTEMEWEIIILWAMSSSRLMGMSTEHTFMDLFFGLWHDILLYNFKMNAMNGINHAIIIMKAWIAIARIRKTFFLLTH